MTADYIAFHAAERPDAVAILDRGREVTYAQFHRDLGRFVRAVSELGLPRGGSVAVAWGDFYPHWLLVIACEELGLAAATFVANERSAGARLLETVDLVLSDVRPPEVAPERHHALTPQWLAGVFARAEAGMPPLPPTRPGDPLRIVRTSGTTGVPKRLLLTRGMFDAYVERKAWSLGVTRDTRTLVTMPFTSTGGYTLCTATIRAGGTVLHAGREMSTAAALAGLARNLTHLRVTPLELKLVLDNLPPEFPKPEGLKVCTIGAALAAPLRERALARLASEVIISYASNEMPFVTLTRASGSEGIGAVVPWVDVEIVDDRDAPLPPGAAGRIRLRDTVMAEGYLDDPEGSAQKFRNGWFYPGDVGILHGPRRLQIVGREDELLNLGGVKIAPSELEAWVGRYATVGDIGVCMLPNREGVSEIYVAVANPAHGDAELLARVTEAFRHNHVGQFHIVKVGRVPRNANGKIERNRLREMIAAGLGRR
ncbi:MAG TPA: class I adenylate-forming enzyme family protein [Stellaceae bacterium]|nr:class I adenylate-forming enzyme family protein [Stellaceae bacterium]